MDTKLRNVKKEAIKFQGICLGVYFVSLFMYGLGFGVGVAFFIAACLTALVAYALYEYLERPVEEYARLQEMQEEMKAAVEAEIKSERMKAELITNVSHDLKTPLTGITTYVELLKKEDITEEERNSYIETLERKSARMKVLIEDLFDLSKASSQDVTLDITEVDLVKLMKQVVVEHQERYDEMGLELIWHVPEEKVVVPLDNQKAYRIFENLFLNIEKYAMKNSRVYVDVTAGDAVEIAIRNMSAEPLHIPGEQLVERFVRGDQARHTEGSGLGLAIAKSFTEVQKGKFTVTVDGDLFKTQILF